MNDIQLPTLAVEITVLAAATFGVRVVLVQSRAAQKMRQKWISRHALPAIALVAALSAGCEQKQDRDALFKDVSKRRGAYVVSEPNLTRVEIPTEGGRSYYHFTQPGHAAYPAVIIRKLEDGTFRTEGFTSGDKAAFERWKATFLERDALRRRIK